MFKRLSSCKLERKDKINLIYVSDLFINNLCKLFNDKDLSNIDKFLYLPNLIYSHSVFNKTSKSRNQFIQLNASLLQKSIGTKYKKVVDFLENNGFIEIYHHYRVGTAERPGQSKSYKLAKKYQKCKFYLKETKLINTSSKGTPYGINHKYIYKELDNLSLDWARINEINKVIEENAKTDHAKECVEAFLQASKNKEYYWNKDNKTGRIFNIYVNCPKFLRPFLIYKKEKLKELDIINCQPLLLTSLYDDVNDKEYKKFKNITENYDFYDYIINKCHPELDRKQIKTLLYQFLFGWHVFEGLKKIESLFLKEFPTLLWKIRKIKKGKGNHIKLPILLQKKEADAMINTVVSYARKNKIPVFPIHDSFMCLDKHKDLIKKETIRVFQDLYNLTPRINEK